MYVFSVIVFLNQVLFQVENNGAIKMEAQQSDHTSKVTISVIIAIRISQGSLTVLLFFTEAIGQSYKYRYKMLLVVQRGYVIDKAWLIV